MKNAKDAVKSKESQQAKPRQRPKRKSLIKLDTNPDGSMQYASGKTPDERAKQWEATSQLVRDAMDEADKNRQDKTFYRLYKSHDIALKGTKVAYDEDLKAKYGASSKTKRSRNRLWGRSLVKGRP